MGDGPAVDEGHGPDRSGSVVPVSGGVGLAPANRLGGNLREAANDLHAEKTMLNGVRAIELTTAGLTYFLSRTEPARVLRVQASVADGAFSFDVTPLPAAARNTCSTMATSKLPMAFSCRAHGSRWVSWYRSHNGRAAIRAYPIFTATVNSAQDVARLVTLLEKEQQTT